jgi:Ca-activated chloride channel family protein
LNFSPYLLLLLLVLPAALVGYWLIERRRPEHPATWASPALLRAVSVLLLVLAVLLVVGVARPKLTFGSPYLLLVVLLVPLAAVGYWLLERRRRAHAAAWASPDLLPNMVSRPGPLRIVPTLLFLLAASLLLVGFARPQWRFSTAQPGATIVLAVDVSGSMAATDVKPSRLGAVDALLTKFVTGLPPTIRVALVTFSQNFAVRVPPTFDHAQVIEALPHTAAFQGSAISDAVVGAVQTAVHSAAISSGATHTTGKSTQPPAAVLIASDGGQNSGQLTPDDAAALARKAGVPVSALAIGTPGGSVTQELKVNGTSRTSPVVTQVPAQPATLEQIATASGGTFFPAQTTTPASLDRIYKTLSDRVVRTPDVREITVRVTVGGFALMLAGAALSGLWFRRVV